MEDFLLSAFNFGLIALSIFFIQSYVKHVSNVFSKNLFKKGLLINRFNYYFPTVFVFIILLTLFN